MGAMSTRPPARPLARSRDLSASAEDEIAAIFVVKLTFSK